MEDEKAEKSNKFTIEQWETERLILTKFKEQDLEVLANMLLNYNVSKSLSSIPIEFQTVEDSKEFLVSCHETYHLPLTIKIKETNEIIGEIYYSIDNHSISLSYWIGEKYQRKGFASEATIKLSEHIFKNCPAEEFTIDFDPENVASHKLAIKIKEFILAQNPTFKSDYFQRKRQTFYVEEITDNDVVLKYTENNEKNPEQIDSSVQLLSCTITRKAPKKIFPVSLLKIGSEVSIQDNILIINKNLEEQH